MHALSFPVRAVCRAEVEPFGWHCRGCYCHRKHQFPVAFLTVKMENSKLMLASQIDPCKCLPVLERRDETKHAVESKPSFV